MSSSRRHLAVPFILAFALALAGFATLSGALAAVPEAGAAPPSAAEPVEALTPPVFLKEWGGFGTGPGQFDAPLGIAVNAWGEVYVSEYGNSRVQKFTADGTFLTQWGGKGFRDGEFYPAMRVAVDTFGSVYVTEHGQARIQRFDENGGFLNKWGGIGTDDGKLDGPYGIAVDAAGSVYVMDRYNSRVQKFTATGGFVTKWGSRGDGPGQFKDALGIAAAPSGHVYIVDSVRVQEFSANGDFLRQWGSLGKGEGQFAGCCGVAVDRAGRVYVADANNYRIQVFTAEGKFLTKWGVSGSTAPGTFWLPVDVAVDAFGNVYVLDRWRNCVLKFGPVGEVVDKIPPVTKVSGLDKLWHNQPEPLNFSAKDNAGGSGVAYTEARLRDWWMPLWGPWERGLRFVVPAVASHADDGDRQVQYRSVDLAGNVEKAIQVTVLIDTRAPKVTAVLPASVIRGRTAVIKFKVVEGLSPQIRVKAAVLDAAGKVRHSAASQWLTRKGTNGWSFTCRLSKGKYSTRIIAYDRAGNESAPGFGTLAVK